MVTTLTDRKLRSLVKESVREALESQIMKLRAFALPGVSKKEQKDIEKRYGTPSRNPAKRYALDV